MQSIFNRPEFLKALKTRVDRVSDEEREEFRKIVNDSYDLYESLYHSSSSWNNAIEMGWVLEVNNKYVLHPTDNISLRIQSLRMLAGFEREYVAAIIGVTRQTYTKLEASGFEGGLVQSSIDMLIDKTMERLYLIGENPKFATLWNFLVSTKEISKTMECVYGHRFDEGYGECPYCDVLDLELGYEPTEVNENTNNIDKFDELVSEENKFFDKFLEQIEIKKKVLKGEDLHDIFKKRRENYKDSEPSKYEYIFYTDKKFNNIEIIKEQLKIIGKDINAGNHNMVELLIQSEFLSQKLLESALPDGLYEKYIENPERHRDTVDDYLADKNLDKSEIFDQKHDEIILYLTYLLKKRAIDW